MHFKSEIDRSPGATRFLRGVAVAVALLAMAPTLRAQTEEQAATIARNKALVKADNAWIAAAMIAAYMKQGIHDPEWDGAVRVALTNYLAVSDDAAERARFNRTTKDALARAIGAGCTDPMILLIKRRVDYMDSPRYPPDFIPGLLSDFEKIRKRKYDPVVTFTLAPTVAQLIYNSDIRGGYASVVSLCNETVQAIPAVVGQYHLDGYVIESTLFELQNLYNLLGGPFYSEYMLYWPLKKALPDSYLPYLFQGIHYAGYLVYYQPEFSQQADAMTAEIHRMAREDLEIAYQKHPKSLNVIVYRMTCTSDPADFELWYNRGMALSPENVVLHESKLNWLRKNGSADEAEQFARACLDDAKLNPKLAHVLIDYHYQMSWSSGDEDDSYFQRPQVFADCASAYGIYFRAFPSDEAMHCEYAILACKALQWRIARQQFALAGDHPNV
jgi:hypothetical protein